MIETIIFDLSDVYIKGIFGSHVHLEKKMHVPVSDEYFYNDYFHKFMLGQISENDYWKIVIKKNSLNISVEELKKEIRKNFIEIKGVRDIIEKLKKRGYILVMLSNHGKEWVEYCENKYSYHKLFHSVIYSYQVKLSKPDKKIFNLLIAKLHLKPRECLFIDDNKNNVLAAESFGMKTIQFINVEDLEKNLKKFNINIYQ